MRYLKILPILLLTIGLAVFAPALALAQGGEPPSAVSAEPSLAGTVLSWIAVVAGSVVTMLMSLAGVALARRSKDSRIWGTVNSLWVLMQAVVAHVEREIRPHVQKALADGKLSPEEARLLKDEALKLFKEAAGTNLLQLQKLLGLTEGALGTFVSGLLERALSTVKNPKAPSPIVPHPDPAKTPPNP